MVSGDILDVKEKSAKCHWGFLIKEMKWMSEDFERETKKKLTDSKKQARACKKRLNEQKLRKEKEVKDQKVELRRKAVTMSRMVQQFWKSIEKVVKHNYNVLYEKKRQQIRSKKLESFVSKHLKLSVKVAEELNTKSFVAQSMHNKEEPQKEQEAPVLRLYGSQDELAHQHDVQRLEADEPGVELLPYKRRKTVTVYVRRDERGEY